jgi:hypothetical protein
MEHTSKELGLLKQCSYKKHTIQSLSKDLDNMKTVSSRTIGKLGGIRAVLDYRVELGGFEQAYQHSIIDNYTNKRGLVHKAHFTTYGRYLGRATSSEPIQYLGWLEVSKETIHKWEIKEGDLDFKLFPVIM